PEPIEGPTRSNKPPNPQAKPIVVVLERLCPKFPFLNHLYIAQPKIATQSGIVEFNSPVIPEERNWAPQVNKPRPPRNNVPPKIMLSFHCFKLIGSLSTFVSFGDKSCTKI